MAEIVRGLLKVTDSNRDNLTKFGFSFEKGSVHTKRTMMLKELEDIFAYAPDENTTAEQYFEAIYTENCTGKKSGFTRRYTAQYLKRIYILDPSFCIFRALRFLWDRDTAGRPQLAFLCAYTRDSILRKMTSYVLDLQEGSAPSKDDLHEHIARVFPDRFSPIMTASLGRNLLSTWTQAGYLQGRVKKLRRKSEVSPGAVAFALLMGFLNGERGELLFSSEYAKLLDCRTDKAIELAEDASRRGWCIFKRVGDIVEVAFPNILKPHEMEWLRE